MWSALNHIAALVMSCAGADREEICTDYTQSRHVRFLPLSLSLSLFVSNSLSVCLYVRLCLSVSPPAPILCSHSSPYVSLSLQVLCLFCAHPGVSIQDVAL